MCVRVLVSSKTGCREGRGGLQQAACDMGVPLVAISSACSRCAGAACAKCPACRPKQAACGHRPSIAMITRRSGVVGIAIRLVVESVVVGRRPTAPKSTGRCHLFSSRCLCYTISLFSLFPHTSLGLGVAPIWRAPPSRCGETSFAGTWAPVLPSTRAPLRRAWRSMIEIVSDAGVCAHTEQRRLLVGMGIRSMSPCI